MKAVFKGLKGAARYRGVSFVGNTPSEVTPEWMDACSNPNITEAKAKKPKKAKAK